MAIALFIAGYLFMMRVIACDLVMIYPFRNVSITIVSGMIAR